ncbi:hypothetical protein ACFYPB_30265 [Streptomyces olivaceoviridis]|uniref:hypothetical protein n=1 Tax=Streptomyces olivaceoviridis TaxID=1921 RepID=UPI0036BDEEED
MRRVDFDWMVRPGWVRSPQSIEVYFGTSRAGAEVARPVTADRDKIKTTILRQYFTPVADEQIRGRRVTVYERDKPYPNRA